MLNSIFEKSAINEFLQQKMDSTLNEYVWGDLKLFYSTTSESAFHLMSRTNRTQAILGEGALAIMLCGDVSSSVEELESKQHTISRPL